MFWFIIFLIALVASLGLLRLSLKARAGQVTQYLVIPSAILAIWVLISGPYLFFNSLNAYTTKYDLQRKEAFLPTLIEQKKQVIELIRDELSPEEFAALVNAIEPEAVQIVLNQSTAASDLLIDRANRLVALNQEIYRLENEILKVKIDICVDLNNPFVARLPFFYGECTLDI